MSHARRGQPTLDEPPHPLPGDVPCLTAPHRLHRLGLLKSTFDVNKHIEPKHILAVMQKHPELSSDLPPIPAAVAIKSGFVFKP